jgi:hypothetical protein
MKSLFIFMVLLISGRALMAQTSGSGNITLTLPTVALLDIHPAGNISMNFSAPTEAGNPLGNPTSNNTKWLNYTSAVSVGNTRIITASVNQMIPGINIRLQAGAAAGSGGGARGTSAGLVTLITTPATIISGIGGAFTGDGTNNGHQLTLSLVPGTYANIIAQSYSVIITYTISGL